MNNYILNCKSPLLATSSFKQTNVIGSTHGKAGLIYIYIYIKKTRQETISAFVCCIETQKQARPGSTQSFELLINVSAGDFS